MNEGGGGAPDDPSGGAPAATASSASWPRILAASLNNIGAHHHARGQLGAALRHYQRAVRARMDALRDADETTTATATATAAEHEARASEALAEEGRLLGGSGARADGSLEVAAAADIGGAEKFLDLYLSGTAAVSEEEPVAVIKAGPLRIPNATARQDGGGLGDDPDVRGRDNRDSAITLFNMACCHLQSGSHNKSASLFDMALSVASPAADPGLVALILHGVATLQYWGGSPARAMGTSARAMSLLRLVLAEVSDDEGLECASSSAAAVDVENCVASTLSLMGRIHYTDGEPAKALELCREALRLRQLALGDDHLDTCCAWYNLGLVLERCGRADAAAEHCRVFAERVVRYLPSSSPSPSSDETTTMSALPAPAVAQIGTALFTAGSMHLENASVTPALRFLRHSLSARRSSLGPDHVVVAETTYRLGEILAEIGTYREAMDCYREAVRAYRFVRGQDSEDAAAVLCSMGQVHHARGELDEALAVYGEVLRVAETAYGQDDEFVAQMEGIAGNLHLERGEAAEAMRRFARATRIMQQVQQRRRAESPEGGGAEAGGSQLVVVPMVVQSFGIDFHPCAAAA